MAERKQSISNNSRRPRSVIKRVLLEAFRSEFPHDTVDISDGYLDNIHVLVVSRRFDRMSEKQKQSTLWRVIDATNLSDNEKELISLVYPVGVAELK
jgi:hypothetical protein